MSILSGIFKQKLYKNNKDNDKTLVSFWTSTRTIDIDTDNVTNKETTLENATTWDSTYDDVDTQPTGLTDLVSKITAFFKNTKFLKNKSDTLSSSITDIQRNLDNAVSAIGTKVSKSGDTMTGDLVFADSGTGVRQIRGTMGGNDYWRVAAGATATDGGWMEIATADNGNEAIYARQYSGDYTTKTREAIILGTDGKTSFPVSVSAPTIYEGNQALSSKYQAKGSYVTTTVADNTYLKKTDASNTYFPKSGGTISGNVTINRNATVSGNIDVGGNITGNVTSTNIYCKKVRTYEICNPSGSDNGYVNFVRWDNSEFAPIRASAFTQMSSKHTKTNVTDISEEDALKLLQIRPINFDYKAEFGGQTDNIGVLAEDTYEVLPKVVVMPEEYTEEGFDESKGIHQSLPSVDYGKFVPYLIKLVQMQQAEIDELKNRYVLEV